MRSKYSDAQKQEALGMIELGDSISFVHFSTGIPERTLRSWRKQLRDQTDCQTAEKTFSTAASRQSNARAPGQNPSRDDTCDNEDADSTAKDDHADFAYIREQLMKHARQMAADLRPGEPDSNRRTLALSRVLDRIQWLDELLPGRLPEQTIRFEYFYDGEVQEHPPWHGASETEEAKYYMSPEYLMGAFGEDPPPPTQDETPNETIDIWDTEIESS